MALDFLPTADSWLVTALQSATGVGTASPIIKATRKASPIINSTRKASPIIKSTRKSRWEPELSPEGAVCRSRARVTAGELKWLWFEVEWLALRAEHSD